MEDKKVFENRKNGLDEQFRIAPPSMRVSIGYQHVLPQHKEQDLHGLTIRLPVLHNLCAQGLCAERIDQSLSS